MTTNDITERLLAAALPHVTFDGWADAVFDLAVAEAGVDPADALAACPRRVLDLAVAYHRAGDQAMLDGYAEADTAPLKIREKVALAVRLRLEGADREIVRRGTALFALPQHAGEGAALIWGTADAIWRALGDSSEDVNWYTKRMTLSALYASVVLFWLGDTSDGDQATWNFLDRRIENVMQIEKLKAGARKLPFVAPVLDTAFGAIRAPQRRDDVPGNMKEKS